MSQEFQYNDGGRKAAGYQGKANDCVARAIAIAAAMPYDEAYKLVNQFGSAERSSKRRRGKSSAREGVFKPTTRRILQSLGWKWTPTMIIGQGCKVHLRAEELPPGRLIVSVSRHLTTMIDGVIHDVFDPRRGPMDYFEGGKFIRSIPETRCVYGYWTKER